MSRVIYVLLSCFRVLSSCRPCRRICWYVVAPLLPAASRASSCLHAMSSCCASSQAECSPLPKRNEKAVVHVGWLDKAHQTCISSQAKGVAFKEIQIENSHTALSPGLEVGPPAWQWCWPQNVDPCSGFAKPPGNKACLRPNVGSKTTLKAKAALGPKTLDLN